MKILVATREFFYDVQELFDGHEVILLPKNFQGLEGDLLVFTGGEDVMPARYGEPNPEYGWFNPERDEWEFSVIQAFLEGKINVKKVLGICRGHQLINVALGGSLFYDIEDTFKVSHEHIHPLRWLKKSPLQEIFNTVNSLHHQGLNDIGRKLKPITLAIEPRTEIVEAIVWDNSILGVQFHPELMLRHPLSHRFKEIIEAWISGETLFQKIEPKNLRDLFRHLQVDEI